MGSDRKRILLLASWYPNRYDPFDGDFVQRHARAAALYDDVHVLVTKEGRNLPEVATDWNTSEGLTEQIVYYSPKPGWFSLITKQAEWRKLYLNAVKDYIARFGKPDLVHVHVPWKAGLIALELKKRYGINYLVTEHWGIYNKVLEDNYFTKPFYFRKALKEVFKRTFRLVTPSVYLAKAIESSITPLPYTVVPNVVDTRIFHPGKGKHSIFTFLHVSNMVPLKRVDGIIHAFRELIEVRGLSNIQLVLVGNREDTYKDLAAHLGLLNKFIFFKGEIAYAEVAKEMQLAHCLVLNSEMENSPCVIGEAHCCGLPVIAPKVGGIPELINSGNGQLLVESDVQGLTEAMLWMYHNYKGFDLAQIAEKAGRTYGYSQIGMLHHKIYQSA
jgi:glycosyltransferase involved in cell wall biosynthesis